MDKSQAACNEALQNYTTVLSQNGLLSRTTKHELFSNLTEIMSFQRKFLAGLEVINKLPWQEQRWGRHFTESESHFITLYAPFCVNFWKNDIPDIRSNNGNTPISNRVLQIKEMFDNLLPYHDLPYSSRWLVTRGYRYPLFLESLLKASSPDTYPYYEELKNGVAAANRVAYAWDDDRRRVDNRQIAADLRGCVADWEGHQVDTFGVLLLHDSFIVSENGIDQLCYGFLFERILLFCVDPPAGAVLPFHPTVPPRRLRTPLILKSHIPVTHVISAQEPSSPTPPQANLQEYSLNLRWRGNNGLEACTLRFPGLRCHLRDSWVTEIGKLIAGYAELRRTS
ncbi:Guanine-nucleotide exchange factor Cdc24 [Mycena venus]|uniref:Guanine-nucleotide exchange factor Cdc24 n=1 Tax=Mycena venus TaxID=2733690 RepID=A0A8H6WUG8_9AGAR|nr:Guanine-nucleotide exchange factor Cdc24 [Mycena venus]